jgi:hypothetical protein
LPGEVTAAGKRRSPWPRLLLLAPLVQSLYLALAWASGLPLGDSWGARFYAPRLFEETAFFYGLWLALVLFYALAVASVKDAKGATLGLFVFLTSISFRAPLLLAPGFEKSSSESLLSTPERAAPLERVLGGAARSLSRAGLARWADPAFNLKLFATAAELATLALLPGILKGSGLPTGLALVYGWNPLAIKESAGSGQPEAVAVFFLAVALRAFQRKSRSGAATAFGVSLTGSLAFGAALPAWARAMGTAVAVSLLLGASGWGLSYLRGGEWQAPEPFGGSLLPAVSALFAVFLTRNPLYPLGLCLLLWGIFVTRRALRGGFDSSVLPLEVLLALGGWLMIAPRLFPWSFVPLGFLGAFSPNPGWLVFTATAPLGYFALCAGASNFWLGFAQYFPAYFVLMFGWLGRRGAKSGARGRV